MSAVLGVSAWYHDSAAALVDGNGILAAAQEERFTRIRHDASVPMNAVRFCLERGGVKLEALEWLAFHEKPLRKFDRILESHFATAPFGFGAFAKAVPVWLREKLHAPRELRRALGESFKGRLVFTEHHEAHAASAFFPSPFERAAIITCDGAGEWATTTWGTGAGNRIDLRAQLSFPHSLGLLYSAFTGFCGFKVNSGEYKLMGLAPFGEPRFKKIIFDTLLDLKSDGSFRLAMDAFDFAAGLRMTNARFMQLVGEGRPAREPEERITQRECDLAASIQAVTEEVLLTLARHVARETNEKALCLAGGVALNCVAVGRLLREGPFERIWVQPAAGDAGGALGAALFTSHQLLDRPRVVSATDSMKGALLGPSFSLEEISAALGKHGVVFTRHPDFVHVAAKLLSEGNVIGWFQDAMEFGPRALGSRSILADPRSPKMQSVLNVKVKQREGFRPFAPSVLAEESAKCFELDAESPYMSLTANVRAEHRVENTRALGDDLVARAAVVRSKWPGITHLDFSARLQTVDAKRFPRFHELLEAFHEATGCPMLINTSFNVRGEPIVCTPEDAASCFLATGLDALIIGDCVALKIDQRTAPPSQQREFEPD